MDVMDVFNQTEKLWDMANLITGFAIAQNLATTFALAKGEFRESLKGVAAHWVALAATVAFTALYVWSIVWVSYQEHIADPKIWRAVTWGRVGAVLLFTLVTLGALCGHWRDERRRGRSTSIRRTT